MQWKFLCPGLYTLTAIYTEKRPDLARDANAVAAEDLSFDVSHGPASALMLVECEKPPERVVATNAAALEDRMLIRGAVLQVRPILDRITNVSS